MVRLPTVLRTGSGVRRRPVLYVGAHAARRSEFLAVARRWPAVKVLLAASGRQALQCAASRRLRMVVVDARVGDVDACTLSSELREAAAWRSLPVVVVGEDTSPRTRARMRWGGVDAYLTSPLTASEADLAVGGLLDQACQR